MRVRFGLESGKGWRIESDDAGEAEVDGGGYEGRAESDADEIPSRSQCLSDGHPGLIRELTVSAYRACQSALYSCLHQKGIHSQDLVVHPHSASISQSLKHEAAEHANREQPCPIPGSEADLADE